MNDQISGKTLNAITKLVCSLRADWQEPGVADAVAKAAKRADCRDGYLLARSAVRAAQDTKNRTPTVIALDGRHWFEATADEVVPRPATSGPLWEKCNLHPVGHVAGEVCEGRAGGPPPASARAELDALRVTLAATRTVAAKEAQRGIPTLPAGVAPSPDTSEREATE